MEAVPKVLGKCFILLIQQNYNNKIDKTMDNQKISSFGYTTKDIRLVGLNKADKQMLKDMGFSRLPSSLSRVEFLCVNKCYQGIGMKNDIGGYEVFNPEYAQCPFSLKTTATITLRPYKPKGLQVCCLFYDFLDYLAFWELKGMNHFHLPQSATCIIMSHVSNFMHMVVDSDDFDEVYLFFPNTDLGKTISKTLQHRNHRKTKNCDVLYKGHRNLCEFVKEVSSAEIPSSS